MTQEDKELLLKDLCARLPYKVKIMRTGWDSDGDTDFETVETLIGIDDRFIYTIWDRTGDRKKHFLSISNWKPYLRPMSSMTDKELVEFLGIRGMNLNSEELKTFREGQTAIVFTLLSYSRRIDWLNKNHFDYRGLIPKDLAIEITEKNNPYKE